MSIDIELQLLYILFYIETIVNILCVDVCLNYIIQLKEESKVYFKGLAVTKIVSHILRIFL